MANALRANAAPRPRRQAAAGAQLLDHRPVVGRIDDDPDVGVVLGRGPHHGRTADVDEIDARIAGERVQAGDDEGDRLDAVVLEVAAVIRVVGVGEDPAVDDRVKGHDPMAEDGREPGELGDVGDRHAGLPDGARRPATRQQPPAELVEVPCASSVTPRLSYTDSSAVGTGRRVPGRATGGRVTGGGGRPAASLTTSTAGSGRREGVAGVDEADGFGVGDVMKVLGGGIFLVAGFLPWWQVDFEGLHQQTNAFDFLLTGWLPVVVFVAIGVVTVLARSGSFELPAAVVDPRVHLAAAGGATVLVVWRFVFQPGRPSGTTRSAGAPASTWPWPPPGWCWPGPCSACGSSRPTTSPSSGRRSGAVSAGASGAPPT